MQERKNSTANQTENINIPEMDAIVEKFGDLESSHVVFWAESLGQHIDSNLQTYSEYREGGRVYATKFSDILGEGSEEDNKANHFIKGALSHGGAALSLSIFADPEKEDPQKRKELSWISEFTHSLGLDDTCALSLRIRDLIQETPNEKVLRWKEETKVSVQNWIRDRRDETKKWWNSPSREKAVQIAGFGIGFAAGFAAANKFEIDPQTIRNVHILAPTLARGLTELTSNAVANAEKRNPKFAEKSKKIVTRAYEKLASLEKIHPKFAKLAAGLAAQESVSNVIKGIGKTVTKIQTHPVIMGFSVGALTEAFTESLVGQDHLNLNAHKIQPSEVSGHTLTPEPSHTPHPTSSPTPEPTPNHNVHPTNTPDTGSSQTDNGHFPQGETHHPDGNGISSGNSTTTVSYQTVEHVVQPNDDITKIVEVHGYYPYGEGMNYFIKENHGFFTNPLYRTQDQIDSYRRVYDFLQSNPNVTWQDVMNASVKHEKWALDIGKEFTGAFKYIRPGTIFNVAQPNP